MLITSPITPAKAEPLLGRVYEAASSGHFVSSVSADNYAEMCLLAELGLTESGNAWGPLFYSETREPVFWARNIWFSPFRLEFDSIGAAATALRGIQRNWYPTLFTHWRRAALIQSCLPSISRRPRPFPWLLPDASVGAWTLLDEHTLLASASCSSPFPGGVIEFEEDKNGPPSRAYLKLWEALVRCRVWPHAGERCLDAGASPGGWTWALARLGADVIAVDRAPLAEQVARMPGVCFMRHNAFSLLPEDIGSIDWLFCDVICYPDRLYEWLEKWLAAELCENFVCTIKTQGANTRQNLNDTLRRFTSLGGQVIHLYHNKHELTWLKVKQRPDG